MSPQAHVVRFPRSAGDCGQCHRASKCLGWGLTGKEAPEVLDISAHPKLLKRGDKLFHDGEKFTTLYALRSGAIKSYKTTPDGEEQILDFHLPGDLIGLNAIVNEQHTCHAVALDTTSVCAVEYDDLMGLCARSPKMQQALLKRISACMNRDEQFLVTLGTKDATQRLAAFLVALSEYYGANGFSSSEFALPMSRTDIANYLNLAVETVSRIFSRFQRDGIVSLTRHAVTIHDMERMYTVAGRDYARSKQQQIA